MNRKTLAIGGTRLGTYSSREVWESEPSATYRDFAPDFGVDLPPGDLSVSLETGEILSHDSRGNVASRHGFIATIRKLDNGK